MNYAEAKAQNAAIVAASDAADAALKAIPGVGTGSMGLTPDRVKSTPEYRAADRASRAAFAALRNHNAFMVKNFKREMAADRAARRAGGAA